MMPSDVEKPVVAAMVGGKRGSQENTYALNDQLENLASVALGVSLIPGSQCKVVL